MYSKEDRAKIFLNHLAFYNFHQDFFQHLLYDNELEVIIEHINYSPRHIEFFIKHIFSNNNNNQYSFFRSFTKYLDNPYHFWENIFIKQSFTGQTILLSLFISSDPIALPELKVAFNGLQVSARQNLNLEIYPLEFENELKTLEELFLNIKYDKSTGDILIEFQNPGIKDYLLEYLRLNMDTWGQSLISGAKFFNQLIFIFANNFEIDIYDYDSDISMYGNKIQLDPINLEILRYKLLKEFHQLKISTPIHREFLQGFNKEDSIQDIKYWKLTEMAIFFNIELPENEDIKKFILSEILPILDFNNDFVSLTSKAREYFPEILKKVHKHITLEPLKILNNFYSKIEFTNEFISFYQFKEIFPIEFLQFVNKDIIKIRKKIKDIIFNNIDYYYYYDISELDNLIDFQIEFVCELYGIRLTKKFISIIEDLADRDTYLSERDIQKKNQKFLKNNIHISKIKQKKANLIQ